MTPAAVVVNLRVPGILQQPDVVLIDNRTEWGNPYRVGIDGDYLRNDRRTTRAHRRV